MKILVLNGSPRPNGSTADMVGAFERGAAEVGHTVNVVRVANKNIRGCLGCENTATEKAAATASRKMTCRSCILSFCPLT